MWKVSFKADTEKGPSLSFTKYAFKLVDEKGEIQHSLVLVQYVGDEKISKPFPHRNNKRNRKPYMQTTPSRMEKFKEMVQRQDPHMAYKEAVNHNLNPRNQKQFRNLRHKFNQSKRIGEDEIINVHKLYFELKIVQQMNTIPDIRIVSYEPDLVDELNNFLKFTKAEKIMCVYDTTFNICNYFVSPLLMRFSMFEEDPVVPVGFFFHELRTQESHTWFFEHIKTVI